MKSKIEEIKIHDLDDFEKNKTIIIKRIMSSLKNSKKSAFSEFENSFDYAYKYCVDQKKLGNHTNDVEFFISTFSDTANILEDSFVEILIANNISLYRKEALPSEKFKEKSENNNPISINLYIKKNQIHLIKTEEKESIKTNYILKSKNNKTSWCESTSSLLSKSDNLVTLEDFLRKQLPDYSFSASSFYEHPLYQNPTVSCYPLEKDTAKKVDLYTRFSEKYKLPEKEAKYARPILELEMVPNHGPCVRCYLTLAARPRDNKPDKDIYQEEDGKLVFKHVNLMNFGDPLRALTWVEDYVKNPEHGPMGKDQPIIRTFLIPLSEYSEFINNDKGIEVDSDRAPGQVRIIGSAYQFKSVKNSLTSFTNQDALLKDGNVMKLEKLSHFLLGKEIHPEDLAEKSSIAHQHGRLIDSEEKNIKKVKKYNSNSPEVFIELRQLERNLSGFGLEPKTKIDYKSRFLFNQNTKETVQEEEKESKNHNKFNKK